MPARRQRSTRSAAGQRYNTATADYGLPIDAPFSFVRRGSTHTAGGSMFVGMKFAAPSPFDQTQALGSKAVKRGSKRPPMGADVKGAKKRRIQSRRPRPENTHTGSKKNITGRWTKEEHEKFLEGINIYGKEWKKIASMIETRTVVQIRTHAQKYFQKLAKKRNQEMKHADSSTVSSSPSKSKKSSRRSSKSSRSSSSTTSQRKQSSSIPFKVSLNLSLQLPTAEGKANYPRENSPTSVTDLGSLGFMPGTPFASDLNLLDTSLGGEEQLAVPLSNWLNDVKTSDSDSSDSCSLGSTGIGQDTIYVDTRYGFEGHLESIDFNDVETMFSGPSLLAE